MPKKHILERLFELRRGVVRESYAGEAAELEKAARNIITAIDDANIRYAMFERYINGMGWSSIADIFGCGTADAVRKRCERYVRTKL